MIDLPLFTPSDPYEQVTVSIYHPGTGNILTTLTAQREQLNQNIPPGHSYVNGAHDGSKRRINPVTKVVEPYQPPQPDADHEWDADQEEWVVPTTRRAEIAERVVLQREIETEEKNAVDALLEWAATVGGGDPQALAKIRQADAAIKAAKSKLAR